MPDRFDQYFLYPKRLTTGNHLTLLRDGKETFPAMLEAISRARRTVHLETYIFRSDRVGDRFAKALSEAAARGVSVRVQFDAHGSRDLDEGFVRRLAAAGIWVHAFNPVRPWKIFSDLQRRDHRKILVADGKIGFIGGINIGEEYLPVAEGGGGWRDNHVRVEGPAAAELDGVFLRLWNKTRRTKIPSPWPEPAPHGRSRVTVIANRSVLDRFRIRNAYVRALKHAKRTVEIANAYFLPDRGIRRRLRQAAARGIEVRLLLPSKSDVPVVYYASRKLYKEFLKAGVRIFEFQGPMLHSKTVLVDRTWCAIGSYNMDHRSLLYNLEINLHSVDPHFGKRLGETFEEDFAKGREIFLEDWKRRPWTQILLESLCYAIRFWL